MAHHTARVSVCDAGLLGAFHLLHTKGVFRLIFFNTQDGKTEDGDGDGDAGPEKREIDQN